jgi:hypothetical protein
MRGIQCYLIERFGGSPGSALEHPVLVDRFSRERFILIDRHVFAGIEDSLLVAGSQQMPDCHLTFFIDHGCSLFDVIHLDIKDRAANGNYGTGSSNSVVIG